MVTAFYVEHFCGHGARILRLFWKREEPSKAAIIQLLYIISGHFREEKCSLLKPNKYNILMCLNIGTPKTINCFPFVPNGKLMV